MTTQQVRLTSILVTILMLLLIPTAVLAQDGPRLYLSTTQLELPVGQQTTVDILVADIEPVYGTEVHLSFDPTVLEVVELSHGDFLSADPDNGAFVIQNEFDNQTGTVDYAMSLLNPAPPAQGEGVLLHVTFKGKAEGETRIEFMDSLFGTQTGEEVIPVMENSQVVITPATQSQQAQVQALSTQPEAQKTFFRGENDGSDSSKTILGFSLVIGALVIMGLIGLVALVGFIGIWFWMKRSRQNKRTRNVSA